MRSLATQRAVTPALPLLVGQALELWRAPLHAAVRAREAAAVLAGARMQLAAGAAALDLNVGVGDNPDADVANAEALRWAASTLQSAGVTVPLWLDCGDTPTLTRALEALESTTHPPLVANAVRIEGAREPATVATHQLLDACSRTGAAVVCSPRFADGSLGMDAILEAHADAHSLVRTYGLDGAWYLDCLAYPPPRSTLPAPRAPSAGCARCACTPPARVHCGRWSPSATSATARRPP